MARCQARVTEPRRIVHNAALFDTTNGLRQTERAMMGQGTGAFVTPATGLVVVTITILPL
jgi:hypothetical protein